MRLATLNIIDAAVYSGILAIAAVAALAKLLSWVFAVGSLPEL